jgi:cytochrome c oxidase subunit 2
MNPHLVFGIFIILGGLWTGIWVWAMASSRRATIPYTAVASRVGTLRPCLFYALLAIAIVAFGISMVWLPYPLTRVSTFGQPRIVVDAVAQQWTWRLSQHDIPLGVPVEFLVTAKDVNHGFAVYDAQERLLAQDQAMPGHPNRLIYRFDQPGPYTVRCLEYCGLGHTGMLTKLTVS